MKSFFKISSEGSEKIHKWLKKNRDELFKDSVSRTNIANYNTNLYLGIDELDRSNIKYQCLLSIT